ncbi:MAG: hypothetical protein R3C14_27565 [Caldilineaceae bacterium]
MKVILSRKGFDASAGGVASPIFPDGRIVSLPIPDPNGTVRYDELTWESVALGPLVESLTRGRISRGATAHLDPDIYTTLYPHRPDWRPLFGQDGAAQSHLVNQGVAEGDLFLFFGWFRQVEANGDGYRFVRNAPDQHLLYGWLQVGEVWSGGEWWQTAPSWARYHPHCRAGYTVRNTLYCAAPQLTLPGAHLLLGGAGVFTHYHGQRVLTAPGRKRAEWRLPRWFYPHNGRPPLSYHSDRTRWTLADDFVHLRSAHRGQEFVLDTTAYPEALPWLSDLLQHSTQSRLVQWD